MTPPVRRRHRAAVVLGVVTAVLLLGGSASGQVPPLPTELPTLPAEPTEEPSDEPEPSPSPSPQPSPSPAESPQPTPPPEDPDVAGPADAEPDDGASGGQGSLPGFDVSVPGVDEPTPRAGDRPPEVAPGRDGAGDGAAPREPGGVVATAGVAPLAAALPGTFGIGLLAALLGVATCSATLDLTRRGLLLATDADGGTDVDTTRRWRTMAGVTLLAAAALVGILGYLKISLETLVPVQVVYLASAGFGVIVLAAAGGALLVSEQLRADESRLSDIEAALATIADHLAPSVAEPPRLLDRGAAAGDAATDDDAEASAAAGAGRAGTRTTRSRRR